MIDVTNYLPTETYNELLNHLAAAFTEAANSTNYTLRDLLAEALAKADVMPESCRVDNVEVVLFAA